MQLFSNIRLVKNWKSVLLNAHSMWAIYLGMIALWGSDILYYYFEWDTSPRIWMVVSTALLLYGTLGRVWDQGIDSEEKEDFGSRLHTPWPVILVAGLIFAAVSMSGAKDAVVADYIKPPVTEQLTEDTQEAVFLEIAIPFVGRWEGLRLEAYLDIVGVPTVCYGETKGVKLGDHYTKTQCDAMFASELLEYRADFQRHVRGDILASLPVERDVAFTSLTYNVGAGAVAKSTALRRLNAGAVPGACDALTWYNKAGGRVVRGLVNRRKDEFGLCMHGVAA